MHTRQLRGLGLAGLLTVSLIGSALAQEAPRPNCMFPLFCPGPVPPVPGPLLGAPDDPADAPPPPVEQVAKHKRTVHKKHAHKPAA